MCQYLNAIVECRDCINYSLMDRECFLDLGKDIGPENLTCKNFSQVGLPLVGATEAAKILGWDRTKVALYFKRGTLPQPLARLASGPVWSRKQIADYKQKCNIL